MSIQPRLKKTFMDVAMCDVRGVLSHKRVDAELWERVGLAIHRSEEMEVREWKISHYESGRVVLKQMKSRKQAIEYLVVLRTVLSDWRLTYEQFLSMAGKTPMVEHVISLQDKINNGE